MNKERPNDQNDLAHFLKLAAAQVRHRMKTMNHNDPVTIRYLQLLEDLINEQGQSNENSRATAGAAR
jgi:hypothetical protein